MSIYLALLAGVLFAGIGGELFVRGTVGIAMAARISPAIIAATIAAFATSSPELTVSITAALDGAPEIALGDALGSNVVNVALILALAVLIQPIVSQPGSLTRDFPVALLVPFIVGVTLFDGRISRVEGALLLAGFIAWLATVLFAAVRQRSQQGISATDANISRALIESAIGLAFLVAAGKLIVFGAGGLAKQFGLNEFVIGATVVAIGTSTPELATAIISRLRGHDDVGLGTILGSNIFNGLFIVSVAALINPITVTLTAALPALAFGIATMLVAYPGRSGLIGRGRATALLALYVAFVALTIWSGAGH